MNKRIKTGIDKRGRKYTREVNVEEPKVEKKSPAEVQKPKKEKTQQEPQWFDEYKKYNLNKYPIGIPKENVTINLEGDIHSHSVMKWKDPKTGKQQDAYTKEFMKRNADLKWSRMLSVNSKIIDSIKSKTEEQILNGDDKMKQCSAIIKIISHTGLRIGSRSGFSKTANKGTCTLGPENIKINGNTIDFNFQGKSYKENVSSITDPTLAKYLKERKNEAVKSGSKFLFDYDRPAIDKVFKDTLGFKNMKLKDMRTYIATATAKDILFEEVDFAKKLTNNPKENKKVITKKLNECYERTAKVLNNTPSMAKNSYIHPNVVKDWLTQLGQNTEEFMKSFEFDSLMLKNPSLDDLLKKYPAAKIDFKLNEEDEENCDYFNKFDWEY